MKATVLLFPLLGTTHLLYGISPQDYDEKLSGFYMIVNAVLQSSQVREGFLDFVHKFLKDRYPSSSLLVEFEKVWKNKENLKKFFNFVALYRESSCQ